MRILTISCIIHIFTLNDARTTKDDDDRYKDPTPTVTSLRKPTVNVAMVSEIDEVKRLTARVSELYEEIKLLQEARHIREEEHTKALEDAQAICNRELEAKEVAWVAAVKVKLPVLPSYCP